MEDKQIYSSAKSEEIKRRIAKYKKEFISYLGKKRQEKKKRQKPKTEKSVKTTFPVEKSQNIIIGSDADEDVSCEEKASLVIYSKIPRETLYKIITYSLLGLIIAIFTFGVFLTYLN